MKLLTFSLSLLLIPLFATENIAKEVKGNKTNLHSQMSEKKSEKGIKVGDDAPNFAEIDSENKQIVLSKFKGKKNVLLVFYPGDDTPGCSKQLSEIRDNYSGLQKLDVEVFGVNPADVSSHKKFCKKYDFPFTLIVDEKKDIAEKYDSLGLLGFISRTVVLIDKQGKIVLYERGMPDVSPEKIKKLL